MAAIYFAASIRGGQEFAHFAPQILKLIGTYGFEVHIGVERNLPSKSAPIDEMEIFRLDAELLHRSDMLVAEVSAPSLGVGYEIATMIYLKKPVYCIRHVAAPRLSAMITGNPGIPPERRCTYQNLKDLKAYFDECFK